MGWMKKKVTSDQSVRVVSFRNIVAIYFTICYSPKYWKKNYIEDVPERNNNENECSKICGQMRYNRNVRSLWPHLKA